tara:strand:+ start:1056 stop:1361 length:306 start_codon:yes stop_codon:yes gene_type:complete
LAQEVLERHLGLTQYLAVLLVLAVEKVMETGLLGLLAVQVLAAVLVPQEVPHLLRHKVMLVVVVLPLVIHDLLVAVVQEPLVKMLLVCLEEEMVVLALVPV